MRVKGILLNPTETFREVESEGIGEALKQLLVLSVIYLIGLVIYTYAIVIPEISEKINTITTKYSHVKIPDITPLIFLGIALGYIGAIVSPIISGIIIHIFVYLFGGRQGITQTMKAQLYAATPGMLFGWIPLLLSGWLPHQENILMSLLPSLINFIVIIWVLIILIIGLRELQKMSTARAVLAVITPIILAAVIVIAIVGMFFFFSAIPNKPPVPLT